MTQASTAPIKYKPCLSCGIETPLHDIAPNGFCPACEKVRLRQHRKHLQEHPEDNPNVQPETPVLAEIDRRALENEQQERFDKAEAAKKEMAARELARRRLLPFIKTNNPGYQPGWVHADICRRLEKFYQDVKDKKSPRLMLCVPPRHGKSEIASRNFPAWVLGDDPNLEIIQSSYASDLALDFSRKVRDLMKTAIYKGIFKTRVDPKAQALERWNTTGKGAYTAVGVRGPITGRGAHIGIIDDPVKDRQDAESETLRQQVKDWYSSTFYTRLAPGGGVVVIMTRWHEDDLAGWLVSCMEEAEAEMAETGEWPADADRWDVIRYPAIAEEDEEFRKEGEALHEDRYPLPALNKIKRTLLARDWAALYQQRPTLADGDYFLRGNFQIYSKANRPAKDTMSIYAAWDLAIGKKDTNDFTVCCIVGVAQNGDIYVLHVMRGRWTSLEIIDKMFDVQETWGCALQGVEQGHIESSIEPVLIKTMEERRRYIPYEKLKHRGMDKVARAQAIRTRVEQGRVWIPDERESLWVQVFLDELVKFPGGKHDDQVDAFAWIGQMLLMFAAIRQKDEDRTPKWMRRLRQKQKRGSRSAMAS